MSGEAATAEGSRSAACVDSLSEVGHTSDLRKNVDSRRQDAPFYSDKTPDNDVLAEVETLEEAKRIYVGKRESEEAQYFNTLHNTAKGNYRQTLEADRHLRQAYDNPSVALLTLCANPVAGGEWVSPLDFTEAVGNALSNVLARLRQLLDSYSWEYVAVRGASDQGVSHWHLVIWTDGNPSTDTFVPAVESFMNNCVVATPEQNPINESVKVNTTPSSGLQPIGKQDVERGNVSRIARYVATQIPHVSGVESLSEAEALQGALEWAADSCGFRCSQGVRQLDPSNTEATHGPTVDERHTSDSHKMMTSSLMTIDERYNSMGDEADILLVEDNPGDIRLVKEAFREGQINNHLHAVTDGQAALNFIYQEGEYKDAPRPDIVLLDLRLPKVDGEDVLHEVKNHPELNQTPVIILSGLDEDFIESRELNPDADEDAVIEKPVKPEEFIEVIREFDGFRLSITHSKQ